LFQPDKTCREQELIERESMKKNKGRIFIRPEAENKIFSEMRRRGLTPSLHTQ
jgi:hypothetical protein